MTLWTTHLGEGYQTPGSMQCSGIWTKASGSVELGEESIEQRQPTESNSSQIEMNINAMRISTYATVTEHIRNSDQQARKHNPALTQIPRTWKKSSTSPINKKRSSTIYMKKIKPGCCHNC